MSDLQLRAMTAEEFGGFRERVIAGYAEEKVAAGAWPAEEAHARSVRETDELLPAGLHSPGTLLFVGETAAGPVGHVWVNLDGRDGDGAGAWIYDIEVYREHRGRGHGRELLEAVERELAHRGVPTLGLNVFAANTIARGLYEKAGYAVTSMHMRKQLEVPNGAPSPP